LICSFKAEAKRVIPKEVIFFVKPGENGHSHGRSHLTRRHDATPFIHIKNKQESFLPFKHGAKKA
jgi:hypothetical protein